MLLDLRFYAAYPEFCEAVKAIQADRRAAEKAYLARLSDALHNPDLATADTTCVAIFEEDQEREEEKIEEVYRRRIAEANRTYNVPVFQTWQRGLKETGRVIFHHVLQQHPAQTFQAELTQHGEGDDMEVTFVYHEVCTFQASDVNGDPDYPLNKLIELHLRYRGLYTESWQSVPPPMTEESALPSDHATLSGQTDSCNETLPFPLSPVAQPGESNEDRLKRLRTELQEGTASDCLKEAMHWLEYSLVTENAELEPISTALDLIARAQSLLFPTANVTAARSSAQ